MSVSATNRSYSVMGSSNSSLRRGIACRNGSGGGRGGSGGGGGGRTRTASEFRQITASVALAHLARFFTVRRPPITTHMFRGNARAPVYARTTI